jgi:hypothetical protein
METESGGAIPFLDVLIAKKGMALTTHVYRKPAHTGRYLNFNSNHPPQVKRGIIHKLLDRASTICQDRQERFLEINTLKRDLQLNGYSEVSSTPLLDLRIESTRKKRLSLWARFIFLMSWEYLRNSGV